MYQLYFTPDYITKVRTRVKRGIKFLEKQKGPNWFRKITMKTLALSDARMCILGQTFKDEARKSHMNGFQFIYEQKILPNDTIDHGFNVHDDEEGAWYALTVEQRKNAINPWTLLGEVWIEEIRKARKRAQGK